MSDVAQPDEGVADEGVADGRRHVAEPADTADVGPVSDTEAAPADASSSAPSPQRGPTLRAALASAILVVALALGGGYLLGRGADGSAAGLDRLGSSQSEGVKNDSTNAAAPEDAKAATAAAVVARATAGAANGTRTDSGGLSTGLVRRDAASLGEPAPDFRLRSLDDEQPVALSDFLGQPVVVNFWATWCVPCRVEMPFLQAIADRHAADGLVVLAVDVQESYDEVLPWVVEMGMTMPVLLDEMGDTADIYRIKTFPTTYFIGADGRVASIKRGAYREASELDSTVDRLLADAAAAR